MASLMIKSYLYCARRTIFTSFGRYLPLVQFKLSDIGEGIAEVHVKQWHVKEGDQVQQFDDICEVQSDKASVTITSRYDGVIKKLYYEVDDIAKVGDPLCDIEVVENAEQAATGAAEEHKDEPVVFEGSKGAAGTLETGPKKPLATPAVRQLAKECGVNLEHVVATGLDGRVLREDVLKFAESTTTGAASIADTTMKELPTMPLHEEDEKTVMKQDENIPLKGLYRTMIKTMTEALKIPHFHYCDEVNLNELISLRAELKKYESVHDVKLSYLPLIIKAISLALNRYPRLNAVIDEKLEYITCKASHNICVAMATPEGLSVPNIKNCEQRSVWEIAAELNRLQQAGQRMQISLADLKDGTFTISNIGAIGGTYAGPVISPPQVAIGAIGKIEKQPRYDEHGNIYPASIMKFSWAADHRVIDGATIANFSNLVKSYLENPGIMIADMK